MKFDQDHLMKLFQRLDLVGPAIVQDNKESFQRLAQELQGMFAAHDAGADLIPEYEGVVYRYRNANGDMVVVFLDPDREDTRFTRIERMNEYQLELAKLRLRYAIAEVSKVCGDKRGARIAKELAEEEDDF